MCISILLGVYDSGVSAQGSYFGGVEAQGIGVREPLRRSLSFSVLVLSTSVSFHRAARFPGGAKNATPQFRELPT